MGSHSPISNGAESPRSPRRSPTPPAKTALQTQNKSAGDKVGGGGGVVVESGVSNETGETAGSSGKMEQTTANKAHARGVASQGAGAIAYHRAASTSEETEGADAQESAEYSPPRVYYRSFRDQGCQMYELDLPILDFRDFLQQASPLLPYGWGVSPIEDSCSKGLCLTHTVVDALSLDSVWHKIVVVLPIRRIVRDRGRMEELECHVLVKRRPPSLLDDDVSLNPRNVNWENCVKTFRHVGEFIAMLREGGKMLDDELGGNSSPLIDHQLRVDSKGSAAAAESQIGLKGGVGRNHLRTTQNPPLHGDLTPPDALSSNAPQYVYVQYAAAAAANSGVPTTPPPRLPSRSPSPVAAPPPPPPPPAVAPPTQAIYFIDPVTHQIWTTTAPSSAATPATQPPPPTPPSSVIKVVNNDPTFPPTPPKDVKPQIIAAASHGAAAPLRTASTSSGGGEGRASSLSPAPSGRRLSTSSVSSPTRQQQQQQQQQQNQRIVYSELDAISKLRSLEERRKKPATTSSGGREFDEAEEDDHHHKRGPASPSGDGQVRFDRRGGGGGGRAGGERETSPLPGHSSSSSSVNKKMAYASLADAGSTAGVLLDGQSHPFPPHHAPPPHLPPPHHLQQRLHAKDRRNETNAPENHHHHHHHLHQQGLPLLAASAALASPVAVPAASSGNGRGGNANEIRNSHLLHHPHRQQQQHHHHRPHSPPSHHRDSARSPSPSLRSPSRPQQQQQQQPQRGSSSSSLSSASQPPNQIVPFSQRGYPTVVAAANDEPSSSRASSSLHHPQQPHHLHHHQQPHHRIGVEISSPSHFDPSTAAQLHGQRLPLNLKAEHDQQQQSHLQQPSTYRSSLNRDGEASPPSSNRSSSLALVKSDVEGALFREREEVSAQPKYHHQQHPPPSSHRFVASRSPSPSLSPNAQQNAAYPPQHQQQPAAVRTQVSFNPATLLQQSGAGTRGGKESANGAGVYLWQCPVCQKPFMRKSSLVRHEKTHTGERPYGCPHCEKRFIQKSDLNRHIGLHTGQKPFKCSQCDKSYTQSNSLLEHSVRAHQCSEPYPCPHCPQRFMQRHMLTLHLTKGHRLPAPPPINHRAAYVPTSSPSVANENDVAAAGVRKRERSQSPIPRVETPPLAEEVVVGTSQDDEGESPPPTSASSSSVSHAPYSGVLFQSQVVAGVPDNGAASQPPRKIRVTAFRSGEEEEDGAGEEGEGMEVMDLRVGSMGTNDRNGLSSKN